MCFEDTEKQVVCMVFSDATTETNVNNTQLTQCGHDSRAGLKRLQGGFAERVLRSRSHKSV